MTLEQRIIRFEDIEQISQLKARYAHYLDNGFDADGIASLFAEGDNGLLKVKQLKAEKPLLNIVRNGCVSFPGHCIL